MNLERIKLERQIAGYTQKEMAQKLGVTEQGYQYYEYGKRKMNTEIISKIADVFDCSVDYLLGRTEKREVNK